MNNKEKSNLLYAVEKYFNKKKISKKMLIDFIEMKQDYNQECKDFILLFENIYKEKY